ncbi:hypothetical protein GTV15_18365 [Streptomyces sp. SID7803]|nr:hypothetical protein [Streptomyces sp. SID7803]
MAVRHHHGRHRPPGRRHLVLPGRRGGGTGPPRRLRRQLGYAQKLPDDDPNAEFLPGVDHGYLASGSTSSATTSATGSTGGATAAARSALSCGHGVPRARARAEHGHAAGAQATESRGYCFLTLPPATSPPPAPGPRPFPGQLHGPTTEVSGDPVQAEQDLEPRAAVFTW